MDYFVYILYSLKDKKLYVGCTSDLENRIKKHNDGNVISTKNRRPLVLIHSENFQDKAGAFNRERFLKSLWGGRTKRKVLKEYL
ncbi:MAG: GIY-YIG nuclease family protein [Candidatus Paceibacterota bacterium]